MREWGAPSARSPAGSNPDLYEQSVRGQGQRAPSRSRRRTAALTCGPTLLRDKAAADPRGRVRARSSPAPKAQPPRKRSGKRTAGSWHSGKRRCRATSSTDGRNSRAGGGKSLRSRDRGGAGHGPPGPGSRAFREVPMAEPVPADEPLLQTPLHDEHVGLGARMVPFAGFAMPVQYPTGILAEHLWTRDQAGLFDVSHMGQAFLAGPDHAATARALEALVPADLLDLKPGRQRYSQLLDENGGILDDLMIARSADPADDGRLMLVVNASTKDADY